MNRSGVPVRMMRPGEPDDSRFDGDTALPDGLEPDNGDLEGIQDKYRMQEPNLAAEGMPAVVPLRVADLLDSAFATAERRRTGEERPVPVPWREYSAILGGGYWPGVHTTIGGTGVGKSQIKFQIAMHAAQQGVPVLYVGLELSEFQVVMRAAAESLGIGWSRYYTGQASTEDMERLRGTRGVLEGVPLYVEFGQAHGWAPSRLVGLCEAIRFRHPTGPLYVVLDFLQLVAGEIDERGRSPDLRERIARAAYAGVHIANRYGASVDLVSSAARDKYALLASDMKGCGLGTRKTALGTRKVITSPEALIGLGKESGEIEFSVETQTVLVRWPAPLDNGDRLIVAAVPKLRYGPPSWTTFAFGRRFEEYQANDLEDLPAVSRGKAGAGKSGPPDDIEARVLATVRRSPGLGSASKIAERTEARKADVLSVIKRLLGTGQLLKDDDTGFSVPDVEGGNQ